MSSPGGLESLDPESDSSEGTDRTTRTSYRRSSRKISGELENSPRPGLGADRALYLRRISDQLASPTSHPAAEPDPPPIFDARAYTFDLPPDRIAQVPTPERDGARLLVTRLAAPPEASPTDGLVRDLPEWLRPNDVLVVNDTRVAPARLLGVRTATGGRVEALVLEQKDEGEVTVLLGTRGRPLPGEDLAFANGELRLRLLAPLGQGLYRARLESDSNDAMEVLQRVGRLPLPPYIRRDPAGDPRDALDRSRYQTVFATKVGAVAAPTAGLHLTNGLLARCRERGVEIVTVTLHVGLGTFRPVEARDIREHAMHEERYEISEATAASVRAARLSGGRVVAIGTTSARVLESAANDEGEVEASVGSTRLFIHPPYRFRAVDALLTNFHAPGSSLLLLLAAFAGRERMLATYAHALAGSYRFLSYGDATLWV